MKKLVFIVLIFSKSFSASAQSQEIQQLLLNWEKLAQLKSILQNMYEGYEVVSKGYNTIKNISQGNYSLHQVFLDGLLEVSPAVRKYRRIADIIAFQKKIVHEYKKAFQYFKELDTFSEQEISYIGKVYGNLFKKSIANLDELMMVITASTLRMSDDERLKAIDEMFSEMQEKLIFLRSFNNNTKILALQRQKELSEINQLKKLSGVK